MTFKLETVVVDDNVVAIVALLVDLLRKYPRVVEVDTMVLVGGMGCFSSMLLQQVDIFLDDCD